MFFGVNVSVKFNFFGHIHLVILNRSSEYSSSIYVVKRNLLIDAGKSKEKVFQCGVFNPDDKFKPLKSNPGKLFTKAHKDLWVYFFHKKTNKSCHKQNFLGTRFEAKLVENLT